ncbi:MAG: hypothetical protein KTR15_12175 [Phycisphaeraceae bacterium]|nr:hypothetical protein [Phycisphaeraceae bacterium]
MPVYHFTFHAYGTWLPDHPKGYARREKGALPPDEAMAGRYREQMKGEPTAFSDKAQAVALQALIDSQLLQHFTLYAVASEASHLHVVLAWDDEREPVAVRSRIKTSMTRALNQALGRRTWFVKNAGQTPVRDELHLHELAHSYLPSHGGLYWCRKPQGGDA